MLMVQPREIRAVWEDAPTQQGGSRYHSMPRILRPALLPRVAPGSIIPGRKQGELAAEFYCSWQAHLSLGREGRFCFQNAWFSERLVLPRSAMCDGLCSSALFPIYTWTFVPNSRIPWTSSSSRIDLETRKLPVRVVVHTAWLRANIVNTRSRASTLRVERLSGASPLSADIDIGDDALISEVRRDIAISAREVRQCFAPRSRIWRSRCHIRRYRASWKEPCSDTSVTKLCCIDAAAVAVELLPERGFACLHAAASIPVCTVVAICCQRTASLLPLHTHRTPVSRMQRHLVPRTGSIRRLHNIDLAVHRPIARICQPKRRPGRAAIRRMNDIEDEKASVICVLAFDPHAQSASARIGVCILYTKYGGSSGGICEILSY